MENRRLEALALHANPPDRPGRTQLCSPVSCGRVCSRSRREPLWHADGGRRPSRDARSPASCRASRESSPKSSSEEVARDFLALVALELLDHRGGDVRHAPRDRGVRRPRDGGGLPRGPLALEAGGPHGRSRVRVGSLPGLSGRSRPLAGPGSRPPRRPGARGERRLPDRPGVGSRGAALLPRGVRGLGALRGDRPPHDLPLQGRGRLLDARRLGSAARERGLGLPQAARGGGRARRLRRVLLRSPRGGAGGGVPVGSGPRGRPPLPAVGRRRRPAAPARRHGGRRGPLRSAALPGSAARHVLPAAAWGRTRGS